jgi:chemotaxis protein MotB
MGIKKPKQAAGGAPEWVLTYGDMMSLLLCFFILLAALSELKKDDSYKEIVDQIQKAFGMEGIGGGPSPSKDDPQHSSLLKILQTVATQQQKNKPLKSSATDPGQEGREQEVTVVRKGHSYIVGGRIVFLERSTELSAQARQDLTKVAQLIRGYNNIVEIRGHTSSMEGAQEGAAMDLDLLSFERARAVRDFLTSTAVGIPAERLRLVACADREPLVKRVYDQAGQTPNRRVEIMVDQALVDEFRQLDSE